MNTAMQPGKVVVQYAFDWGRDSLVFGGEDGHLHFVTVRDLNRRGWECTSKGLRDTLPRFDPPRLIPPVDANPLGNRHDRRARAVMLAKGRR